MKADFPLRVSLALRIVLEINDLEVTREEQQVRLCTATHTRHELQSTDGRVAACYAKRAIFLAMGEKKTSRLLARFPDVLLL